MNFEDENYVRLYVRKTITWKLIEWQGRCLLPLLLKEVDRSGCLDLEGFGAEGVAALVDVPIEVVKPGLDKLIEWGVVEMRGNTLVLPRFLAAHASRQSDKLRAANSRAKRRDSALNRVTEPENASRIVTGNHESLPSSPPCHTKPPFVTNRSDQRIDQRDQISGDPALLGEASRASTASAGQEKEKPKPHPIHGPGWCAVVEHLVSLLHEHSSGRILVSKRDGVLVLDENTKQAAYRVLQRLEPTDLEVQTMAELFGKSKYWLSQVTEVRSISALCAQDGRILTELHQYAQAELAKRRGELQVPKSQPRGSRGSAVPQGEGTKQLLKDMSHG